MPEIAFIMGKSASGKDKIFKKLCMDENLNLKTITMYTTRPMRIGEENGKEYFFVDDTFVNEMIRQNKIIEIRSYNTIYGEWKYFTLDDGQIDMQSGEKYVVIGTLEAYNAFSKYYGKEHLLPIYIEVNVGIRLTRAIHRENKQDKPNYDEICRRFLADSADFSEDNIKKAGINKRFHNESDIDECVSEIKKYICEFM